MNKTSEYDFTILVPVFNEEENIPNLEKRLSAYLPTCLVKACVIFINDGSKDRSGEALKEICERNEAFFYIGFARNRGKGAALKAGYDNTFSKYVGILDADLQTAPEDFNLLLEKIEEYPLVTGIRTNRKDTLSKRLQSKFGNGFRRMMTGDGAIDTGCPLKVMHTDYARRLPSFEGLHRFIPALIMLQEGGKYCQIPVRHFPRTAGVSKFSLANRFWGPLGDCFAYRWMRPRFINYSVDSTDL